MRPFILALFCLPPAAVLSAEAEPVALLRSIESAKPLNLEVAYITQDVPLTLTRDPETGVDYTEIDADFYSHSGRAQVRLANEDLAQVTVPEKVRMTCAIKPAAADLREVNVHLDFFLAGQRDLQATLIVPPNRWVLHNTRTWQTRSGQTRYFYAVVRLMEESPAN